MEVKQEVTRVEPKPQPRPEPKVEPKFEAKPEPPKPTTVQPKVEPAPPPQTKPFESQKPVQQIKPLEPVQPKEQHHQATTQNHFQSNQSFDATDFSHTTRQQQQQQQEVFQQQTSIQSHQQQQHKFESHSSSFASHSSSERKDHHELKHHELNMQVKSGGVIREQQLNDQEVEDYIGSLRPTTTGAVIRSPQPGDGIFTSAPSMESQQNNELFSQSQLKKTQREGVFGGIAGDHNSLATDAEEYERHTVRNLVQHFSKTKTGDIPLQYLPQQSMQNTGNAPPLSYLKEQAKSKDFSYKEKTETTTSSSEHSNNVTNGKVAKKGSKDYIEDPEVRLGLFQRRGSLKDYLMMDEEKQKQESLPSIQDPSAILQVDGSVEEGLGKKRMMRDSNGRECDSQGRLIDTDKWDNHNTIARGWLTSGEDHYQPVTFRRIYGAKTPSMQQPIAASPMPNTTTEMAHPPNNNVVPVDYPEEECADL